jgi:hypothetical protein
VRPRISTAASDDWHGMVAAQLMARGSTETGRYSILGGPSRNARAMAAFRQQLATAMSPPCHWRVRWPLKSRSGDAVTP